MMTHNRCDEQGRAAYAAPAADLHPCPPPPYARKDEAAHHHRRWSSAVHTNGAQPAPVALTPPPAMAAIPGKTPTSPPPPRAPPQQQQPQQQPQPVPSSSSGRQTAPHASIFNGRFTLLDRLGSGGFGDVYRAEERDQGVPLAVKVEQVTDSNSRPEQSFLFHEAKVLQEIHKSVQARCAAAKADREARRQRGEACVDSDGAEELNPDSVGITKLKYYGQDGMQRVLIMSLHGHSVENVHRRQGRLSLFATVMIADQMLSSLEHVHAAGYVHADLKPDNILFGRKDPEQLYLVDFGLSVRFRDRDGRHRPLITNHSFVGTPRYASLRTHMGYTLSRRDDIEQLVYVMIYLYRGRLPWSGLRIDDPDAKEKHIAKMKANLPLDTICAGCPEAFRDVLHYARCMEFEEEPHYEYLHLLLTSLREACTAAMTGEPAYVPAAPAVQQQQQQQQQQQPVHGTVNTQQADKRAEAAPGVAVGYSSKDPNILPGAMNEAGMGDPNAVLSGRGGNSPAIFSDAIGQGILSGNGTDGGPLSPRIDCLDAGRSPTCLPLSSPH